MRDEPKNNHYFVKKKKKLYRGVSILKDKPITKFCDTLVSFRHKQTCINGIGKGKQRP